MSDQDLVARAKAGDQTAFERLDVDNQNKDLLPVRAADRGPGGGS